VLRHPLPDAPRLLAFSILRIPYFLEPDYDENEVFVGTNRQRLIQKWGGKAGWERQKHRHDLKGRGLEAGIPFFNLDRKASSTMASHRLIQYLGKTYGLAVSEAVYDKLNEYYFVDGHSLNDKPKLARITYDLLKAILTENPPSEDGILEFLNGDEGRQEITNTTHALNQLGISGIPKFIIEGRTMVDGAARSDTFIDIFRQIEKRGSVHSGPIFNDVLGVSDETIQTPSHFLSD
jgi:predicted DsbA family dithiol-disulfide isomerase